MVIKYQPIFVQMPNNALDTFSDFDKTTTIKDALLIDITIIKNNELTVIPKAPIKNINLNQTSIWVKSGLYVFNCKRKNS